MNTASPVTGLEHRIRDFTAAWSRLGEPGVGDELVADPILVLGPQGTSAVPREVFLGAVAARQASVSAATTAVTTLTETTVTPLGDRLVMATMTWSFGQGRDAATLVSDLVTMVAVLHHLEMQEALREVRRLLAPGGRFLVVGLAPPRNVRDHLWDLASIVTKPMIGYVRRQRTPLANRG